VPGPGDPTHRWRSRRCPFLIARRLEVDLLGRLKLDTPTRPSPSAPWARTPDHALPRRPSLQPAKSL